MVQENLLKPAELREKLSIGMKKYEELTKAGMPYVPISVGKKVTHKRYNLDKVIAWLEERDTGEED